MMTTGPRRPAARFWAGVSAAHGARLRTDGYFGWPTADSSRWQPLTFGGPSGQWTWQLMRA